MLYLASTLPDRSIQCRHHTARCALSHTLPHQHSHSPYFHKPYYTINITLNKITSQYPYETNQNTTALYPYKTKHNFTVPLLFDTMQGCTTQYLNHAVLYPCFYFTYFYLPLQNSKEHHYSRPSHDFTLCPSLPVTIPLQKKTIPFHY